MSSVRFSLRKITSVEDLGYAWSARHEMSQMRRERISLSELLQKLNPVLRGWGNYYRFCTGASRQFAALDFYVGDCIWRWLMKKHKKLHRKRIRLVRLPSLLRPTRKLWREGNVEQFLLSMLRVERFRRSWMRTPAYIGVPGEPDA